LAIAAVLGGASWEAAAMIGGMDRQTLRDWVMRFNEMGPDGLINMPSPGAPAKLDAGHEAVLIRIVEEGPIPAIHGVVRWRACDLIMRPHEEFALSVSDDICDQSKGHKRVPRPMGFQQRRGNPNHRRHRPPVRPQLHTTSSARQSSHDATSHRGWVNYPAIWWLVR
jgi:transposase